MHLLQFPTATATADATATATATSTATATPTAVSYQQSWEGGELAWFRSAPTALKLSNREAYIHT